VDGRQTGSVEKQLRSRRANDDVGPLSAGPPGAAEFVCECADPQCTASVALASADYESVRRRPGALFLRPGHELPAVERVVERRPDFVVVERRGEAGRRTRRDAGDPAGESRGRGGPRGCGESA
jgi:hypothetical protein